MVVPGFQDAHAHPLTSGLELLRCSLTDTDPDDYAAATTRWAADHPDAPWLLGGGWRMDAFPGGVPPAGLLDRYMRDLTLPFVSAERADWQYPWASLRRAGATLAFGSDWSVSTPDPLALIEVAVNRVAPDDRAGEPFLPVERLDLPAALDAATIGAAYANRLDATTGSIEPGKLADTVQTGRSVR
jgi:predicted amidohydrolase YtcJ